MFVEEINELLLTCGKRAHHCSLSGVFPSQHVTQKACDGGGGAAAGALQIDGADAVSAHAMRRNKSTAVTKLTRCHEGIRTPS
eukprot:3423770-Pleurochrysis_carterae.AAC.1